MLAVIKKEKKRLMQIIKYLINILGSGILSWGIWYSYKLWVLPPIGNSKSESIELLKSKIVEIGIEKLSWAIWSSSRRRTRS
jgi:hypothetical protein